MKRIFIGLSTIAALSACHQSPGVSAESAQNTDTRANQSISDTSAEGVNKSDKLYAKQELLNGLLVASYKAVSYIERNYLESMSGRCFLSESHEVDVSKCRIVLPRNVEGWASELDKEAERYVRGGDQEAGKRFVFQYQSMKRLISAMEPSAGWVDYKGLTDAQSERKFVHDHVSSLQFANLMLQRIVEKMHTRFNDPSDLRHDVIAALLSMDRDELVGVWRESGQAAKEELRQPITIDRSSAKGTVWIIGPTEYSGQENGWIVKRAGNMVLGDGYIGSVRREYEVASSVELSSRIEHSDRIEGGSGNSQSAKGEVSVK